MNDIQQARDVLAKWREKAAGTVTYHGDNRELIVGTAGNPDLWDAIDAMFGSVLDWADVVDGEVIYPEHIERIAAAIIAADERMSA